MGGHSGTHEVRTSVRASLLKVVQQYARHNGHAGIIRERIDGARGE
jgi:hypothetical protein